MSLIIFKTDGLTAHFKTLTTNKEEFEQYKAMVVRRPNHCNSVDIQENRITFDFKGGHASSVNLFRNKLIKRVKLEGSFYE